MADQIGSLKDKHSDLASKVGRLSSQAPAMGEGGCHYCHASDHRIAECPKRLAKEKADNEKKKSD
jgi:hypothetical protein